MRTASNYKNENLGWKQDRAGISIFVMIGILAILSILALSVLRSLVREIDHRVAREETEALKAQAQALQRAILRKAQIPAPANWASMAAEELGQRVESVASNPRRRPRLLLVDPSGWFTNVTLPYTQTMAGSPHKPWNARLMLVSSLGTDTPALAPYPSSTEFTALWDCRDGQVPSSGAWTGWNGRPEDVRVERIVLDPLFVELRLATSRNDAVSNRFGVFALGSSTPTAYAPVQQQTNAPRYMLRGTTVWLYTDDSLGNILDARQILTRSAFYRYESGVWKSSAVGGDLPGGLDLAAVVKGFLEAFPNPNAKNNTEQQRLIVESMMDYMEAYNAWAKNGFPSGGRPGIKIKRDAMLNRCGELFTPGGNPNYYPPVNLACP